MAINREALAERVMEGSPRRPAQWLPRGHLRLRPGHPRRPPRPRRRAPPAGRGRLPNGFRLTLHTLNDRFPNDAQAAQAVAQMWSRIGVQTAVEAMPWATYSARAARQEFSIRWQLGQRDRRGRQLR